LLTNAKKQPFDQSMRNLLIYIGRWRNACGLLVVLRQEEKGENWLGESAMWPQMGSQPDWRSPQAYSAFRECSRGLAGAHKKTPNREWLGFEYWWRMVDQIKTGSLLISHMRGLVGCCG